MSWSRHLMKQIFKSNISSNCLLKGISRFSKTGIVKGTRSSILGLFQLYDFDGKSQMPKHPVPMLEPRRFKHSLVRKEPALDRDFLARLWVLDKELEKAKERKNMVYKRIKNYRNRKYRGLRTHVFQQPFVSRSISRYLAPTSPEEVQVSSLLARANLLITRDIEWADVAFGFEQGICCLQNRYAIVDVSYPQTLVGFIHEESHFLLRQFLRKRRPFVAYITDALGTELFRICRLFWWITSSIYAEVNGKEIGVVHQRWHPWKRIYDLYLGNKQFAVVENPGFWNWTYTIKDFDGNVLADINRNWRGFGFELLTDAGQYVIRFESSDPALKTGLAEEVEDLKIARPLTLSERAVVLALAVSLDNDFFSQNGGSGSWILYRLLDIIIED
ncbi:altered inheritance rate of mitochondria protein 25-like [Chenopodium quinoa]|uniref:altered inheritance rate of mitochondria protein 25-like n=1 Tax=Chenopodium quinoa TaxID=63459 RepID=UPI000B78C446|nr:altered inheritance rate of mitochondria protein 25-like [Chenopodium quinoa]